MPCIGRGASEEEAAPGQYAPPLLAVASGPGPALTLPSVPRPTPTAPAAATVSPREAARLWAAAGAGGVVGARQAVCRARTECGRVCLAPAEGGSGLCARHRAAVAAPGAGLVPWDGRLAVVLDLDQTLVYTPADGEDVPPALAARVHWIVADGVRLPTAVRPHAPEFLLQLASVGPVYVVTGGTPSYCDAVVALLNRLVAQLVSSGADGDGLGFDGGHSGHHGHEQQEQKQEQEYQKHQKQQQQQQQKLDEKEREVNLDDLEEGKATTTMSTTTITSTTTKETNEEEEEAIEELESFPLEQDELPVIRLGVSCRASGSVVALKTFGLVLPRAEERRLAVAVDNCRRAWAPECRDQVVVVPDWAPLLLADEHENLLRHVLERVLAVRARLHRHALAAPGGRLLLPAALGAGDVLQGLYEEEEKARILRRALTDRVDTVVRFMQEQVYF